jgi:hypothetical protein
MAYPSDQMGTTANANFIPEINKLHVSDNSNVEEVAVLNIKNFNK